MNFILHVLFYTRILSCFLSHVLFSLNLKLLSHIFSYVYGFCNHKVLTFFIVFNVFFAIFKKSPYSTNVNNFSIVSFDIIRSLRRLCDKPVFTNFLTVLPNCSAGVSTVVVDKYVNSSISCFGFYDFLWFTLNFFILGPLKYLMTSGSINSINHQSFVFVGPFFNSVCLSAYDDIVHNNVKLWNRLQFYSSDYISTCDKHGTYLLSQCFILTTQSLNLEQ